MLAAIYLAIMPQTMLILPFASIIIIYKERWAAYWWQADQTIQQISPNNELFL